jgi:L,D-transpeptidase ErfK/SrfK
LTNGGVAHEDKGMKKTCFLIMLLSLLIIAAQGNAQGEYTYRPAVKSEGIDPLADTVIGTMQDYVIKKEDTLLDIARDFDLGYQDVALFYPRIDPWLPPQGEQISLPTMWVLPPVMKKGIVINVPELRLYLFSPRNKTVKTYPIGIGVLDAPTPFGRFTIMEKTKDPTWNIPPSLQEEYGRQSMPPGPDNPLGEYRLRLSSGDYGIHGTNAPLGIGRLVSHGCIRLYPEDIKELFALVPVGTPVEIIYEPVKIGFKEGRIFVEVHPDIYQEITDLFIYTARKLFVARLWEDVDVNLLAQAIEEHTGAPVDITRKK